MPVELISSPLNYTGGKIKLLPQILPLFPNNVSTFVDLFCGGCNVAINTKANTYICNDIKTDLTGLISFMKKIDASEFTSKIKSIISEYELSDSSTNGYNFYSCDSSAGLGKYNKQKYSRLRESFNHLTNKNNEYYYKLFTMIIFSFNNQIRFNKNGNFNLPVGKRDFNNKMQKKVFSFISTLQEKKIIIENKNFINFNLDNLPQNSFLYADPPYLITCATYNEKNGWNEELEKKLLIFLDGCNEKKIKFALSNVLETDGKENRIIKNWLQKHPNYFCNHLDFSYKNSNYHKKNITNKSDEVLITNYKKDEIYD